MKPSHSLAPNLISIRLFFLVILFLGSSQIVNGQHSATQIEQKGPELKKLDTKDQLGGFCYAYSSSEYAIPSNGEAHSSNLAKAVPANFPSSGFYLMIDEGETITYSNLYLAHKLYLVNATNEKIELGAQDSRLSIIAEALDKDNQWISITHLESSWCGNSYHKITLGSGEYWEFAVPMLTGKYKTKLRYTLSMKDGKKIHSSPIDTAINLAQFTPERTHR